MATQTKKSQTPKKAARAASEKPSLASKSVVGAEQNAVKGEANPEIVFIPVSNLVWSARNVRRAPSGDVSDLKASIAALAGRLVQNLVVVKEGEGFGVVAGGRRLKALMELVAEGVLSASHAVACVVVDDSEAVEFSLTENLQREAMHPADECAAFLALTEQGKSPDAVAAFFGVEPAYVKRRLVLASVAPAVFERFRAGEIDLDQIMALTLTDDHALQESIVGKGRVPGAHEIRRQLSQASVRASDRRARFVTVKAYEKAGGAVHRDLFANARDDMDDGQVEVVLLDAGLLERLAIEKAARLGADEQSKAGGAWVDVVLNYETYHDQGYSRAPSVLRPETEAEAAERARLEAEHERLEQAYQKEDDDEASEALYAQQEEVSEALDRLTEARSGEHPDIARLTGIVVSLGHDGKARFHHGLIRPGDKKAAQQIAKGGEAGEGGLGAASNGGSDQTEPQSLVQELTAIRSAVIRDALAKNVDYSLRLLAFQLWGSLARHWTGSQLHISTTACHRELTRRVPAMEVLDPHRAGAARRNVGRKAGRRMEEDDFDAAWAWCLAADQAEILDLLAYCTSCCFDDVRQFVGNDGGRSRVMLSDLGASVAAHWTPTADNYFGKLKKGPLIGLLGEHAPAGADKAKRAALASVAEDKLGNAGWMPEVLLPLAS
ncbi:ParB/RepB/Spo0J family partition protein [Mesorhizobium sp. J428]|uniref:ParB/RepB/Spo0J family partition protein n=2 Tax=Mesorhizobium sp. J428 TaxID=2898440 RepID=UPI002150FE34|nr:ParB/RepB/Spo0J family partition protein [Mesorhizobium sp. J428]MCR5860227.1 ParB/RepB/Spo0J family partition protein [Mesorhizobium sp. J428]